ncbi:sensor histidine kinase [Schaalia suimastitidis]|uniref:sensor histidine kinase n=1 Tax=Schaalia suimastitidis TaxID=121163 RepID=UPI0013F3DC6B|nr:HAMP domain-containing sensor histidine kinase [Schaalia suimastitidis]
MPEPKNRRRWTLSARLSLFVALIVATALALMAAAATVAMVTWMMREVDSSLAEQLHRTTEQVARGVSDPLQQEVSEYTQDATLPTDDTQSEETADSDGPPRPPHGLEGPGSNEGQLQVVSKNGQVSAGIVWGFEVVSLDDEQVEKLTDIKAGKHPVTVSIGQYGRFRVLAEHASDGSFIVVGQSLKQVDGIARTLLAVEAGVALVIIAAAAFIGRRWVKREMKPLGDVAETAREISDLDLQSTAQIAPFERVSHKASEGTEVGDVSRALNAMIDNVEGALQARAESEQRLRQFVADASHELRTPLASIAGYTQLLQRDSIDAPTALARIASESSRMSGLVEDLLLLARLDAGRELAEDAIDVVPLVVDAVMDAHAAGPDHQWILDVPDGEAATQCIVRGDEAALRQVLANLVNNARVHTASGTAVRVGVRLEAVRDSDVEITQSGQRQWRAGVGPSGSVVLSVSDDGEGISEELRTTVFDRFVRGDTSRTRANGKGSSGLGLSIVSSIAEAMGGRVEMRTVCAGELKEHPQAHGTTFEVYLPR